ncbi:hypothetical protein [Halarsenatibacter silvermanii]|uniref:Uncharacterized protein n=1 Tax=Halarsenatibacter silvermanii TaxID=321763 RepID=A0A1G9K0Y8_9FIRM|nr:hypothetical protein [Halarsenatibacter silvermanii]SDL42813.1 hypothetical protein SAMN04488692_104129 [Halarsenatibacter silvermanii]
MEKENISNSESLVGSIFCGEKGFLSLYVLVLLTVLSLILSLQISRYIWQVRRDDLLIDEIKMESVIHSGIYAAPVIFELSQDRGADGFTDIYKVKNENEENIFSVDINLEMESEKEGRGIFSLQVDRIDKDMSRNLDYYFEQ